MTRHLQKYFCTSAAEISVVVCDADKLHILLEKADQCPNLKHVIKIGDVTEEDIKSAEKLGITMKSLKDTEVRCPVIFCSMESQFMY